MGYAGGTKANPTYHGLGDHSEAVEIDYDPLLVSYADLLDIFWDSHNPGNRPWSRQYMSAIFYHNEGQKKQAMESKKKREAAIGKVYTEILAATTFYRAEDYHQKYNLRQRSDLLRELQAVFHDEKELIDSTAAARLNGYLAGSGSCAVTRSELIDLLPTGKGPMVYESLCGSQ